MAYDHRDDRAALAALLGRARDLPRRAPTAAGPKFYVLDMFPYPSGAGLHVGHPEGYTATDIVARYKRMRGFDVLHPMGWDAFGLPAEQYAIKTGTHPRDDDRDATSRPSGASSRRSASATTGRARSTRPTRATSAGRSGSSCSCSSAGLAYQAEVPVNWCPALGTVLANEEVIDGKSERGGHPVVRAPHAAVDAADHRLRRPPARGSRRRSTGPSTIKQMQRDWIGRSEGAEVDFAVDGHRGDAIAVFTTRPDTLFGATYMVLAPEHPLVARRSRRRSSARAVDGVRRQAARARATSSAPRATEEKTGVVHRRVRDQPGQRRSAIPIWIADYVLGGYGTGAIMAVPGARRARLRVRARRSTCRSSRS